MNSSVSLQISNSFLNCFSH